MNEYIVDVVKSLTYSLCTVYEGLFILIVCLRVTSIPLYIYLVSTYG